MAIAVYPKLQKIVGDFHREGKVIAKGVECWCWYRKPEVECGAGSWGGEFSLKEDSPLLMPSPDPLTFNTQAGETVSVVLTETYTEFGVTRKTFDAKFHGIGKPPKELHDMPEIPKAKPPKIKVVMMREHVECEPEEFATMDAALIYIQCCIDDNTAGPKSLTAPPAVFGGKPVVFTTDQIYVMLQSIRWSE